MRLGLRVHPRTRVADGQHGVGARADVRVLVGIGLVEDGVGGLDDQLTASRHRVARVHHQVEDHLLHLATVRADAPDGPCGPGHEVHVLPDQTMEHALEARHDLVQVEDLRLQHLLATEGQELAREVGRALRRLLDLDHAALLGVLGPEPFA